MDVLAIEEDALLPGRVAEAEQVCAGFIQQAAEKAGVHFERKVVSGTTCIITGFHNCVTVIFIKQLPKQFTPVEEPELVKRVTA